MTPSNEQSRRGSAVTFGPFRFDLEQRTLVRANQTIRLGSRAREILLALVEHAGDIVGKADFFARVWPSTIVQEGALRVHISALRKALRDGEDGVRYVENVTGQGYRFVAPVVWVDAEARRSSSTVGASQGQGKPPHYYC